MKPYYEHGGITIYHGDCREVLPMLLDCSDGEGDRVQPTLILTDPPYLFVPQGGGLRAKRDYCDDLEALDCCEFDPWELLRMLQYRSPAVVAFCNKELIRSYSYWADDVGYSFDMHVMQKVNPIPTKNNHFLPELEYIAVMRRKESYFDSAQPFEYYKKMFQVMCVGDKQHPAQKPVALMEKYIRVMCGDGVVIDPYMGSGTTLIAASHTEATWAIGIEIEEKYCEIAAKRLSQEVFQF